MIVDESLLGKIDEARETLDEERIEQFIGSMFNNLREECIIQAAIQDGDNERRRKEVISNFKRAWIYGLSKYEGEFNLDLLTGIAGRIEPSLRKRGFRDAEIRTTSARMVGMDYSPPIDEERIRGDLEKILKTVKEEDLHPVEEAVFLYFHLVRTQAFENGNKRTSTALMNLILNYYDLPTICIAPEEKTTYTSLLRSAIDGFREQGATEEEMKQYSEPDFRQRGIYEFLAKKVLDRLVLAKDVLKGLPYYSVNIVGNKHPGKIYGVKRMVSSWFDRQQKVHQVRLNKKEQTLEIIGEIPQKVLDKVLSNTGLKYELKINDNYRFNQSTSS